MTGVAFSLKFLIPVFQETVLNITSNILFKKNFFGHHHLVQVQFFFPEGNGSG